MVNWQFPDDLIGCVLYHHQGLEILSDPSLGRTALGAVALAGLLPDFFQQTSDGLERLIKLDLAWPGFRLRDRLARRQPVSRSRPRGQPGIPRFFTAMRKNLRSPFKDDIEKTNSGLRRDIKPMSKY